jgi:hypothetical protein
MLKRPVGRPAHYVQRFYKSFRYQAASWARPRRVVAKVEWHFGELFPRVGFIVTNLRRKSKHVIEFYNQRGVAEQRIKEWKGALKGKRLSCCAFDANAVRLQLHALAYNLGNFLRTLAIPEAISAWSLTTLREKLIKIGAKVVSHGRYVALNGGGRDPAQVVRCDHRENHCPAIASLGDGNMNAQPTPVREKRRESCTLWAVKPGCWEPSGPTRSLYRAKPTAWRKRLPEPALVRRRPRRRTAR